MESGELEYAVYSIGEYCGKKLAAGEALDLVEQETGKYLKLMQQLKIETAVVYISISRQTALNLRGRSVEPCNLVGEKFNESETLPALIEAKNFLLVCLVYNAKTQLNFLFCNYARALENSRLFEQHDEVTAGALFLVASSNFYGSLSVS